jgi:hypothetical protein
LKESLTALLQERELSHSEIIQLMRDIAAGVSTFALL